jgi:glycosyltransferase involved in cell wall biosynthesis
VIEIAGSPAPGVNLVGYFEADSGLGEIARKLARALGRAGIPCSEIVYRRPPSGEGWDAQPVAGNAPYDINVVCLNPGALSTFIGDGGADLLAARRTAGVWFWETDVLRPDERRPASYVDEIWVASEYVRDAVADAVDVPVSVIPLPIERPVDVGLSRRELGLSDWFIFLYVFDFISAERKNPHGLVDAFVRAFEPGEGPVLVLKSLRGRERKPRQLEALEARVADRPDIEIRDGHVTALERDALIAACDCYVSLHRSEGYGLTMAEAMAARKPVIATGYSGNLEFMSDANALLVPYRLVDVPVDWWAFAPGARWAEPDTPAAAEAMRRVYEAPPAGEERDRIAEDLFDRFSLERTGAFVRSRIDDLRGQTLTAQSTATRRSLAEWSLRLEQDAGSVLREGKGPVARLRRGLGRVLWPYLEEQRTFNQAALDAIARHQRSLESAEADGTDAAEPASTRGGAAGGSRG